MSELLTGLDLGGAHLKLAQLRPDGVCVHAAQAACQLWRGLDRLDDALATLAKGAGPIDRVALTMTGELADLFPDRASGVASLTAHMAALLPPGRLLVYAGRSGLLTPEAVLRAPLLAASMNWLASATAVAGLVPAGLFIDMGSTTTDILVLRAGLVETDAQSDADRLESGELVYVGLTRTPLMALAARAPVAGRWSGVMAELFATTADIWRLLDVLDEAADQHPAADGGAKSKAASRQRLARMVGRDAGDLDSAQWDEVARYFADRQLCAVEEGMAQILGRTPLPANAPLLGAGAGAALVERLARRAGRPYLAAASLMPAEDDVGISSVATCFPAVAVARLLAARTA
ncbi:probable H4MPT-linked C1 transfer pathway protein [Arboricoccus pini]|uniref:Probable H4MPT-linked C1 transfer pathway protein n=1 Tax=Arboricoccus pini TaxID=1963835 RepID=A0A212S0A9_9PROT|nr:hydantoinase/oxoprolinase family protein [Arboricoccus pini]SNB78391.1 probable H4MPT-linked C1 transfer pathway protein [Arboricoccus pini]